MAPWTSTRTAARTSSRSGGFPSHVKAFDGDDLTGATELYDDVCAWETSYTGGAFVGGNGANWVETLYAWDHRNRLTNVTECDANGRPIKDVEYDYDVFDRRIAKRVDDTADGTFERTERYVYDGEDIALVFDGAGSLKNRYLHGPGIDELFADENALGEILWGLGDNQGTIRDVVKYDAGTNTTSIVNHLKYDAFGKITSQSNAAYEPHYAYTGREWDADAEMYYYRARWYDAALGRFMSEDPIGFAAGDANLSRYVGNAPTNFVDPSGLDSLAINFNNNDFETGSAAIWNYGTHSYSYTLNTATPNWKAATGLVNSIGSIDSVTIAGHGSPGSLGNGLITLEKLQNRKSDAYKVVKALGRKLGPDCTITLKVCNVASQKRGKEFIKLLAKITGAKVIAYTGVYAATPSGHEYTATADGKIHKSADHGASWLEKFSQPKPPEAGATTGPGVDIPNPFGSNTFDPPVYPQIFVPSPFFIQPGPAVVTSYPPL